MVDKVTTPKRLEEILAEWDLPDQDTGYEPVTCSVSDTITISSALNNIGSGSPYTVTGAIGTSFANSIWTTTGTNTAPWLTQGTLSAPKINLNGEGADIEVNGWSLVDAVKRIEERLGLYQPNPELEKEWSDLRALAEQYRALEQHIRDKQDTFDRLKAMPPPEVS